MSDTTAAATPSGSRVSKISESVIRIAGDSQDGIQAIGGFLARLAGRSEQDVMTFMTIPSTISGGASIFQVRIGSGEVLSAGDEADVLLCFYNHSYANHISSLKRGKGKGFAGIENPLFLKQNTGMLYGDAKGTLGKLISAVVQA